MMRSREPATVEELGKVGSSFHGGMRFYGVLIQIGHVGQSPSCSEPCFRILRFTESKKDMIRAKKELEAKLGNTGNILHHMRDEFTLICTDLTRQVDPSYVWPKATQLKSEFLEHIRYIDEDFVSNRRARRTGNQEEAKAKYTEYVKRFNKTGWVKYMRKVHGIRDDVDVVPGMHTEAETQSSELNRRDAKAAKKAAASVAAAAAVDDADDVAANVAAADVDGGDADDAADDDDDDDDSADAGADVGADGPPPFPENARKSSQRFAAVSYILDDSDDMEMLLYIHAVFNSEKTAKACVLDELNDKLYPLPVDVVDMYQWIYPIRMTWENNSLSSRVDGLEETCAETLLQDSQAKRREAAEHNRALKEEARKKKKMDAEVQKQLCERLGISAREFTAIIENEDMGTTSIIQLCKIEDDVERMAGVRALLDRMAGLPTE